ncbi:lanthionine synthetase C family protein [Streptomyces sp. NPDC093097]|uniref:lanthionine synthetase C family protein n=1 Tax=Streptomyces sp. NPDC093097 TaxID=3366027 RepID=UPI003802FEE7
MTVPALFTTELASTAEQLAKHLAVPEPPPPDRPWTAQSLAQGAAGIALLHIERAHIGDGTWEQAHTWISNAAAGQISAADTTGLYLGAPAIAYMLHAASIGSTTRYRDALKHMDRHVAALAHRHTDTAMARIHRGEPAAFREYDIFNGLTGIGALVLHRSPGSSSLERILRYLVALTKPLKSDGQELPGWWVAHDPRFRTSARYPGGHGNLGTAHGITGPLLLLSQALRRGITVDGQDEAVETICTWLDAWRQDGAAGPWWPEHITRAELRSGKPSQTQPARPSWCYGTPGIARAGQLAAIATGDQHRKHLYEIALAQCLADPTQLARLTGAGLCHGWAGVYQTAWHAARDAATPALRQALPHLAETLIRHVEPDAEGEPGFLEGSAGSALALTTAARDTAPTSGWDACLLID